MPREPVSLLRALRHPNYRLFFAGQTVSLAGTWITRLATSWLVYRLTGSALLLGIVGFAGQIPTLILAPLAGVYVDRWDRHRVLVVTQVLSMLQSLALAVLTLLGIITVAEVVALQLLQGAINAFDTPARQAFVVALVEDREDVPNAIALNSSMVNGSRVVGPAVGGILVAAVGEGGCFLVDAISYGAVIASLLAMKLPERLPGPPDSDLLDAMGAGFRYVSRFSPVRTLLLLLALLSTMGMPYSVLMPVMSHDVLGGGPNTLGLLMAASGAGALMGTLYLASRSTVLGLGRAIVAATVTFGAALVAFGFSRSLALSFVLLPVVGAGFMIAMASINTILQTIVTEELRGRVMAFYTMAFLGTAPIGSLFAGALAAHIGAPLTIVLGGIVCVLGGAWFALRLPGMRELVRPIYVERGVYGPAGDEVPGG